jgi:hypothetical protein
MNKDDIIQKIKNTTGPAAGNLGKYFLKNKEDLDRIKQLTSFLPNDASLRDRFYYIRNDLSATKKCKYCFSELNTPFKEFCSAKCNINYQNENTDIIKRRSKTISKKYHKKSESEKQKIKDKRRNTNIEKYGVSNNMHIPVVRAKTIEKWIDTLGVDNPSKSEKVKDKRRNTNIEKYGGPTPFHGKEQDELRKATWMKKYGVDNPTKNPDIHKKIFDTYFKRTGYRTPMNNPEVIDKWLKTFIENEGRGYHNKGYRYKIYTFALGRQILVQGWETQALDEYLLKLYDEDDIENNIKIINKFNFLWGSNNIGTKRKYIPDFYIKRDDLFIEVKSEYLFHKNIDNIFYKAKSVIDKGHNFYLLISSNGKKFKKITYEEIETYFKKRNF